MFKVIASVMAMVAMATVLLSMRLVTSVGLQPALSMYACLMSRVSCAMWWAVCCVDGAACHQRPWQG